MISKTTSINQLWANLIVEELIRRSIAFFCISPGSRSTPLTIAIASNNRANFTVHHDERGSAYHALGYAKATGQPAAVICTSGTAAANFYPAVVEAAMEMIPLIMITADRPPELQDCGANQTIDQRRLYGNFARKYLELPCPTIDNPADWLLTTVDHAVDMAMASPGVTTSHGGPVHLNCQFREPLAPIDTPSTFTDYLKPISGWISDRAPFARSDPPDNYLDPEQFNSVAASLTSAKHGLIIAGRIQNQAEREAVRQLSIHLRWPFLADIASGLRLGINDETVVPYYDQVLSSQNFATRHRPDLILQFGKTPVSKQLLQFLSESEDTTYIQVANHSVNQDPIHRVTNKVQCDPVDLCRRLCEKLKVGGVSEWTKGWCDTSKQIGSILNRAIDEAGMLTEPSVCRSISRHIGEEACLFLGNSMPIRDMDMFCTTDGPTIPIGCNRGASGIDGVLATALGFARGLKRPVTLLLGDLSLLHDVGSIGLIRSMSQPVTIVVINNDGGGIFSFLPVAQIGDLFEECFGTPHGLQFEHVARMHQLDYHHPESLEQFNVTYTAAQKTGKHLLIEVTTDRTRNQEFHKSIELAVSKLLGEG